MPVPVFVESPLFDSSRAVTASYSVASSEIVAYSSRGTIKSFTVGVSIIIILLQI
jgi:hypothetical protein